MTEIFPKKSFKRLICLVLATVFLSSFPAGTSGLALCLDMDQIHVIDQQYLSVADCHSSNDTSKVTRPNSSLAGREANDCLDISVSNKHALRRPSEITLPNTSKFVLSYTLPESQLESQQQLTAYGSSTLTQHLVTPPHFSACRTVILLI